jgi:putative ABC transport system substrate-binding protein
MRRREFIAGLGSAAASPLAARAQQPRLAIPVIGILNGQLSGANFLAAFRQGLGEVGFFEGHNVAIVYRSAEGDSARLSALAAELVSIPVAAIAAVGGGNAVLAAKAATATIPIVFTTGSDPVELGIVASFKRPGANLTGASFISSMLAPKQIELLRDMVGGLVTIGFLVDPVNIATPSIAGDVRAAVELLGLKLVVEEASTERDLDAVFARFAGQRIGALIIASAVFFTRHSDRLADLAARYTIPAIFSDRDFAAAGGLMSYGADIRAAYRQAGVYVGRILKGDKPAELPVVQPTKFELVINLKTAKTLGLTIPETLLATADELIQ